jgi:hypothetical protein
MIRDLRVASPCSADWGKMIGDDRVRYCSDCKLNVYDFSAMTAAEIEELIVNHEGRICGRLYRRKDGTVLTQDCPTGFRAVVRRISRIAGTALSTAISLNLAIAQSSAKDAASLVQVDLHEASITVTVRDPSGAVISGARVLLVNQETRSESAGITDGSGKLRLSNLSAGSYLLTVESQGFRSAREIVALSGYNSLDVPLSVDATALMGVVVSVDVPTQHIPLADQIPVTDTRSASPPSKPRQ